VERLFASTLAQMETLAGVETAAVSLGLPYERILNIGFRPVGAVGSERGEVTKSRNPFSTSSTRGLHRDGLSARVTSLNGSFHRYARRSQPSIRCFRSRQSKTSTWRGKRRLRASDC